jgi:hypothetical protein
MQRLARLLRKLGDGHRRTAASRPVIEAVRNYWLTEQHCQQYPERRQPVPDLPCTCHFIHAPKCLFAAAPHCASLRNI